ncbi:carboxypeptidase-like regulatory domain-containing protein [Aquiflexum lacus]|uniref:carboxypeptidase-like regulatory domain-containing protein n=1 Tax=Aquiflexum lacus TaxID=2483805 RepID=UPI001893D12C|nr:carboxypeptidase-like regulatory domain-containing protein [Aquiflexum lacus]
MNIQGIFEKPAIKFFIISFFFSLHVNAQFVVKGKVLNVENLEPIPFATVFISNSSFGDVTDTNGFFEIPIPAGNHELVISFMGFEPFSYSISTLALHESYEFRISPSPIDLNEREVTAERDKAWYDNLEIFKEFFLGNSVNASKCIIKNSEVLILDDETFPNVLQARSKEILEIENPNLGYTIKYVLTGFELDKQKNQVSYSGYPFFIEDQLPKRRQRKVEENRRTAYLGSVMHFIRTLYQGNNMEEGYEIYTSEKVPNPKKPSEEEVEKLRNQLDDTKDKMRRSFIESLIKDKNLPDSIDSPIGTPIDPTILIGSTATGKKFITYTTPVYIVYTNQTDDPAFLQYSLRNVSKTIRSLGVVDEPNREFVSNLPQLSLMDMRAKAVQIFENGSYFHPYDLFFEGYMAWEKVGDLLPFDYGRED